MEMESAQLTGRSLTRDGQREEGRALAGRDAARSLGPVPGPGAVGEVRDADVRSHATTRTRSSLGGGGGAALVRAFLGWISRRPVGWMYAAEVGAAGMWHVHVLVVGLPRDCWPVAKTVWEKRNGRADVRSVDSPHVATLYTTKQAAEAGTVVFADVLDRYLDGTAGSGVPAGERT
jgi:hypothetical protein